MNTSTVQTAVKPTAEQLAAMLLLTLSALETPKDLTPEEIEHVKDDACAMLVQWKLGGADGSDQDGSTGKAKQDWRVVTRKGADDDVQASTVQAVDLADAHARAIALGQGEVVGVALEAAFEILPDAQGDFVLQPDTRAWLASRNLSIRIADDDGELRFDVYPRGRENEDACDDLSTFYSDVALSTLLPGTRDPAAIQEKFAGMPGHSLRWHLAELGPAHEGLREQLKTTLADQLAG